MKLSRRQFLTDFCQSAMAQITGVLSKLEGDEASLPAPAWIPAGRLADFPPGTSKPANGGAQVIHSDARGLWAVDTSSPELRRPIKFGSLGQILLNPNDAWPSDAVLSPLTGEMSLMREV